MTRPTSELVVTPDPISGSAFWARWWGAPWHYTLAWGDGDEQYLAHWEPAVKHAYPAVDTTYTITATPDLPGGVATRASITTRSWRAPPVTAELVEAGGNAVRLVLPDVGGTVRWHVTWGDGTSSEHGVSDAPTHEYPWEFGAPAITVVDVPSRRQSTVSGPEIGPAPAPPPANVSDWFWWYTGRDRRFVLYGTADPGSEVRWADWSGNTVRTVTADTDGQVAIPYDIPTPNWAIGWDTWRSYTVQCQQNAMTVTRFPPVHVPRAQAGNTDVVYEVDEDEPQRITFSVLPAMLGEHHIDFGDGTSGIVPVTALPLRVTHTYTGRGPYFVRVTLPDGRGTEARRIAAGDPYPCDPTYNVHYPGRANLVWYYPGQGCGRKMRDPFDPVTMRVTGFLPHRHHCPDDDGGFNAGYGYRFDSTGWKSFRLLGPLDDWRNSGVTIEAVEKVKTRERGYEIKLDDEPTSPFTVHGWVASEWGSGYVYRVQVVNTSEQARAWQVAFALSAPAVLGDVWGACTHGGPSGREHSLASHDPLPAGESITVDVVIEHAMDAHHEWITPARLSIVEH